MTFAEKLRELRDARGLSEAKLAEASGVAFGALHDYGLGRRMPSFAAVVRLAKALGVDCVAFADCDDVAGDDGDQGKPASTSGRSRRDQPPAEPPGKKPRNRDKGQ
jgi:transcriptional regulator with XRE-family HTH domain